MKFILTAIVSSLGLIGLAGCGSTETTVNVNNAQNATRNAANTAVNAGERATSAVANTLGDTANAISNAASGMAVDSPDDFMAAAARSGMAEVEMGRLAAQKAADPEVKKFGQMMVEEHTKANEELKALAGAKNVTLPTDLGTHQSSLDDLKNQAGQNFDTTYVKLMVGAHQSDVAAFQAQADKSADPEVKALAAKQLPVLKKHLESIQNISSRVSRQRQ